MMKGLAKVFICGELGYKTIDKIPLHEDEWI